VAVCRDGTPGVIPFQRPPVGTEPYLADLPQYARIGLTEIKAAWLILDPKQDFSQRYFHRVARVVNPHGTSEKRLLGLVGLHILRFTPSGKVPATFEQIDNVVVNENASQLTPARLPLPASASFNSGKPRPSSRFGFTGVMPAPINSGSTMSDRRKLNISRVTTIAPAARKINRDYQRLLAGTVWDFYQLIGTQNPAVGDERPIGPHGTQTLNLINTTLQTYTQKGFSCMGCHAHARPKGVGIGEPDPYFKISSFLLQHAQDFKPRGE